MRTSEVTAWLLRKLQPSAEVGAAEADYVTVSPQEGRSGAGRRPSYVQRAKVRLLGRVPEVVADAVLQELEEIARSREAEGDPLVRVKLYVNAAKGSECLAEHVFIVGEADAARDDDAPSGAGAREGELIASLREMRLAAADANAHLRAVSAGGMQLAMEALKSADAARQELAETRGALIVAEGQQYEPVRELVEMLKPMMPVIVPMLVQKFSPVS